MNAAWGYDCLASFRAAPGRRFAAFSDVPERGEAADPCASCGRRRPVPFGSQRGVVLRRLLFDPFSLVDANGSQCCLHFKRGSASRSMSRASSRVYVRAGSCVCAGVVSPDSTPVKS